MAWQLGVVGVSVGMEEMGAGGMCRSGDVTRWGGVGGSGGTSLVGMEW